MKSGPVMKALSEGGLVPVFYHDDPALSEDVLRACYAGGCRIFEFTNRGRNAPVIFRRLMDIRNQEMKDLLLGAGTIMDAEQAFTFRSIGASFTVSPVLNEEMLEDEPELLHIPGCGTASEMDRAMRFGARLIKLFPADVLGPEFIKAVKGPMPGVNIMPSGGVSPTAENLKAWIDAGAFCVGMGSTLFTPQRLNRMEQLEETVRNVLNYIREARNA